MSQGQGFQAVDLNQVKVMRQQQAIGKLQNTMQIALQMFLQGRADNIPEAFELAQHFVGYFENEVIPEFEREQAAKDKTIL